MEVTIIVLGTTLIPSIVVVACAIIYRKLRKRQEISSVEHREKDELIQTLEELVEVRGQTIDVLKPKPYEHHN